MSAQIIYLNQLYWPDPEEQKRLDWLQGQFELYHAEMDYLSRDLNPFQQKIFKESSHNNIRKQWKLLDGLPGE